MRAPHSFDVLREAQRTARRLVIEDVRCLVYELPPFTYDRVATPSLVFESDASVARVHSFPADWRTLSDDDLFALSWASCARISA
jgi:hypothetical protein